MIQYDAIEYSCFNNSRISVLLHHCIEELLISSTCSPIRIGYLAWTGGLSLRCGHGSKHREGHHRHHKLTHCRLRFSFLVVQSDLDARQLSTLARHRRACKTKLVNSASQTETPTASRSSEVDPGPQARRPKFASRAPRDIESPRVPKMWSERRDATSSSPGGDSAFEA